MTRFRPLTAAIAAVALLAAALTPATLPAQSRALDDLMMDLNIAPLEPQVAPPLNVTTLEGGKLSLTDLKGQAVLVYFMATW